jgi:hypothetical protein
LVRTDLLLDALAGRRPVDIGDPDEDALAGLLEQWRDDLRWPPASALVSPEEAIEALHTGLAERGRGRRGLAMIGSVAATLLVLSGFGAVVVEARPGDALYGLHAMFFDQRRVNDDSIELSAKADLAKVQQMIDQGQWAQAQNQLAEVSSSVESMDDGDSRHNLMNQVNLLNTRVESRNPNATLPPAAPATAPPKGTAGNSVAAPAPRSKPPSAPAPSTAPSTTPAGKAPVAPSSPTPSPSPSASAPQNSSASPTTTTPSSGRHRHHHSDAPSPTPPTP